MSTYLCATEETMAICLAQHLTSAPLGIVAVGAPAVPLANAADQLPVTLLNWTADTDLTELESCEPIAVLADETQVSPLEGRQLLQRALGELVDAGHTLVFSPAAVTLAGIDPVAHSAAAPQSSPETPLLPAIILNHIDAQGQVAELLPRLGTHVRLLALDGPVYVEYTPTHLLTVHGAGSILVLTPGDPTPGAPVTVRAYILTDGMTQQW